MLGVPSTCLLEESIPATLSVLLRTAGLLVLSNFFMTYAWYGHLKNLSDRPWYVAALVMRQPLQLDFLWAGLCMWGAVYFVFRGSV